MINSLHPRGPEAVRRREGQEGVSLTLVLMATIHGYVETLRAMLTNGLTGTTDATATTATNS